MHGTRTLAKWHQLSQARHLGPVRFKALVDTYGSDACEVFNLSDAELLGVKGITRQVVAGIRDQAGRFEESLEFIEKQLTLAQKVGGGIVTLDSPDYPEPLKKSPACHPLLYYRGQLAKFRAYTRAIAIVGSRNASNQGKEVARETARELASQGWVISSGLADGIDTSAHRGALEAHGLTVAVVGCGPDVVYPPGSADLNAEIVKKGLILSEFPFGTNTDGWRLKRRNSTIVGLAQGTFVVETRNKGGAMNAVKACQEQRKEIFTLKPPSSSNENFSGNADILAKAAGIELMPEAAAATIGDVLGKRPISFF